MSLLTIGLNHTTAPVEVREKVAFAPEKVAETLDSLLEIPGIEEASLLSTCNRMEVTCWQSSNSAIEQLPDWLSSTHKLSAHELQPYLYHHSDREAVRHILRVACGLDSLVLGEPQILGQLKSAYHQASECDAIGRYLNRLYQCTFSTAKKVRTETEIGSSAVSVAFAAVSLAKQIFGALDKQTALLIGAGETIELAARHLCSQKIGKLLIANRTKARAAELAGQFDGESLSLSEIPDYLHHADIIISSTASPLPILGKGSVESAIKQRKHRPIFMVDIAIPRDIEPEVSDLNDVYLYTVDDLQDVIETNLKSRQEAAEQAEELVDTQVQGFMGWLKSQEAVHLIRSYRDKANEIQAAVVAQSQRMLQQGKPTDQVIDYLAHTLTNKLLHDATHSLNRAAHGGQEEILNAARQIFRLDPTEINDKDKS